MEKQSEENEVTSTSKGHHQEDKWYMDSGCSMHVCNDRELFTRFESCDDRSVRILNGAVVMVKGIGVVMLKDHQGKRIVLESVLYVPEIAVNTISLGRLVALGHEFGACNGVLEVTRDGIVIMTGLRDESHLYVLQGSTQKDWRFRKFCMFCLGTLKRRLNLGVCHQNIKMEKKQTKKIEKWIVDSGCSTHLCRDREAFKNFKTCEDRFEWVNDETLHIEGVGDVMLETQDGVQVMLKGVMYSPDVVTNVISLGKLEESGYDFYAWKGELLVERGNTIIMKGLRNWEDIYALKGSTQKETVQSGYHING